MRTFMSGAAGVLAALAVAAPVAAQRPFSIQDLLTAVRVSDPQVSPDGRLVLFVRTTTDVKANARNSDIWVVPADGSSAPRALITSPKGDTTPRWSPDARQIAFISTRDGEPQVYVAAADGSGVRRVTSLPGGVQPPLVFAPDGASVAIVADVYPDCADLACNQRRREDAATNPVKVHHLTHLLYRHWDAWRDGLRHHVFLADLKTGAARDLTPGDFDSPPTQQEGDAVAFTPDGRELAFVSNREGNDREAWTTNNDVWIVPVSGGSARKLTPNPAADVQPVFTKDGTSLVVRAQRRPGFESDRWYLDVYDRATGTKRTVFESPDLSVSSFALSPDGQTIYFTASSEATADLYRVPFAGGTPEMVASGGAIGDVSLARQSMIVSKSSMTAPAELFRVAGQDLQAITHENDAWLKQVNMNPPESLTVSGAGGTPVQYWLIKPPSFDAGAKHPVVFLIHGGPQGDWGDAWSYRWNPELWAAQGWVIAAPNPRGSTGFGQPFVDAISQDWGGKVMQDLDAVFDAVSKLPYVDATRMGIAGASYGGYAVDWIIGHTDRFKAAVTHDGVFNLESMALATEELWFTDWDFGGPATSEAARENFRKWSPHLFAHNIKTPTLVITNEQDFRVPVDQGLQLFTILRRNGVPSEALVFPDEGHWVLKPANSQYWHDAVFAWLTRFIGPEARQTSR
ncbi:MAG TPA: S9 family peptidase [Vicinamibacterales bacterium]|nr:S9 family peptidase [Vicinamibacterales bacterium]